MKKKLKKVIALIVSGSVMYFIYSNLDLPRFGDIFRAADLIYLAAALVLFVPMFLIRARILQTLVAPELGLGKSLEIVLSANALNVLLPAKGGDLMKGFFVRNFVEAPISRCIGAVVLERWLDVQVLATIGALGLFMFAGEWNIVTGIAAAVSALIHIATVIGLLLILKAPASWFNLFAQKSERIGTFILDVRAFFHIMLNVRSTLPVAGYILLIWTLTLLQYACFFLTLGFTGDWISIVAFVPSGVLAGIVPLTIAGVGTRDAALVALFQGITSVELAAGVGLLSHLRYIIPGLVGALVIRRVL